MTWTISCTQINVWLFFSTDSENGNQKVLEKHILESLLYKYWYIKGNFVNWDYYEIRSLWNEIFKNRDK